jgi:hypothetical protein
VKFLGYKIIAIFIFIFSCVFFSRLAIANLLPAVTEAIPIKEISNYQQYSPKVKKIIKEAYLLSQMKLTYLYGSSDPKNRGMDCSGTMYFLLKKMHISDPPRSSNDMFNWVKKKGQLHRVDNNHFSYHDFDQLKPGDLLFWSGTYATSQSVTHVMIYLGKNKQGKALMFGSSDGRTYQGKKMWGVSVFDFNLPDERSKARFKGYSCIPDLTC